MSVVQEKSGKLLVDHEYETLSFSEAGTQMTLEGPSANYRVVVKDVTTGEVLAVDLFDQLDKPFQRFKTEKSNWPGAEMDMISVTV